MTKAEITSQFFETVALPAKERQVLAQYLHRVHWHARTPPNPREHDDWPVFTLLLKYTVTFRSGERVKSDLLLSPDDFAAYADVGMGTPEFRALDAALQTFRKRINLKPTKKYYLARKAMSDP